MDPWAAKHSRRGRSHIAAIVIAAACLLFIASVVFDAELTSYIGELGIPRHRFLQSDTIENDSSSPKISSDDHLLGDSDFSSCDEVLLYMPDSFAHHGHGSQLNAYLLAQRGFRQRSKRRSGHGVANVQYDTSKTRMRIQPRPHVMLRFSMVCCTLGITHCFIADDHW